MNGKLFINFTEFLIVFLSSVILHLFTVSSD